MKKLKSSLLPMLLAILACGAFFPAHAENKDNAEGSFTPQGESEAIFTYTYHNEVKSDGYFPNHRIQLTEAGVAKGYTSVLVICQIWKGTEIAYQGNIINQSNFDANHAAQGYCHVTNLAIGDEYTTKLVVKLNPGAQEQQYDLTVTTFTVSESSDPSTPIQPTLSISDPSYTYKDASTVTASIKVKYENPDNVAINGIRVGAVGAPGDAVAGKEYRHDWNKVEDGTGDIVWGDILLAPDHATGTFDVTFDLVNLPENADNIHAYFKAYIIPAAGDNIVAAERDLGVSTVKPDGYIEGLVKQIDSKQANISYTAAVIENGEVVWTIPQTIKDQIQGTDVNTFGISGRYITVMPWKDTESENIENEKKESIYWAPEIPYTIGNDDEGYIHVVLDIPEENLPKGFAPFMVINNNKENRTTPFAKSENGKWEVKSKYPYPNNSTISYYFRANMMGDGQLITRTFGYKVENVTNETSEPYTITTLAEKALGEGNVSGQIYTCYAHATDRPVSEDEQTSGQWYRIARPVDYANTTDIDGEFYFCPPFEYIIANDAKAKEESQLYVAVKFLEHDGKTLITCDFTPSAWIYDLDKISTQASTRAYNALPESAVVATLPMEQVPGMVNTYQTTSTNTTFPIGKNLAVGFRYEYHSIIEGNGFSTTAPRNYVMSSNNEVITGIEEVASEAEAVPAVATVYNLQGMAVRVNVATENALEGLPAGIYIVNGKKYAVR